MAEMQNVEAAVRDDKFFSARAKIFSPCRQCFPCNDFVPEIHAFILPLSWPFANTKNKMSGFAFGVHLLIDSRDGWTNQTAFDPTMVETLGGGTGYGFIFYGN
jgi:hypothetical protein